MKLNLLCRRNDRRQLVDRFWMRVIKTDGCWGWKGDLNDSGYAMISLTNRPARASRISWRLHFGPIPEGLCVLHRCDNRVCTNPAHLFLGTRGDNNRDAHTKGRARYGERHRQSKLTLLQVQTIIADHRSSSTVAPEYGVSPSHIRTIRAGLRWVAALAEAARMVRT